MACNWAVGSVVVAACLASSTLAQEAAPADTIEGWGRPVDPVGDCSFSHEVGVLTIKVPGAYHDLWPGRGKVNAPLVLQEDFFNSLCAAYRATEIRAQLDQAGLLHFQVEEVGELHIIAWGRT